MKWIVLTVQLKYNFISVNMNRANLARQVDSNNKIKF